MNPSLRSDLVPCEARRTFSFQLVEPVVQLLPLGVRQRKGVRVPAQALPKLVEKVELLVSAQPFKIQRNFTHAGIIPQGGADLARNHPSVAQASIRPVRARLL